MGTLNTNELAGRIEIEHVDFINIRTTIMMESLPSYNGMPIVSKNFNIFKLDGGLMVLEYLRMIPYGIYEQMAANNLHYDYTNDPNYHKLVYTFTGFFGYGIFFFKTPS